jgi:hypothetical protein
MNAWNALQPNHQGIPFNVNKMLGLIPKHFQHTLVQIEPFKSQSQTKRPCHVQCERFLTGRPLDRVMEARTGYNVDTTQTENWRKPSIAILHTAPIRRIVSSITNDFFASVVCIHSTTLCIFLPFLYVVHH